MEEQRQKNWFGRNWTWVVPVGGCLTLIILFVLGIGAAIFGVTKAISGSEPYEYAVEQAKANKDVQFVLGEPIETNGIMQGNISLENGDSGHVDIKIPIKGPKDKGHVYIVGEKVDGKWVYEKLQVKTENGENTIYMLDEEFYKKNDSELLNDNDI